MRSTPSLCVLITLNAFYYSIVNRICNNLGGTSKPNKVLTIN